MVVLMNACKEEKNGNLLSVERRMIAGTVTVILELENARLIQIPLTSIARANLDIDF